MYMIYYCYLFFLLLINEGSILFSNPVAERSHPLPDIECLTYSNFNDYPITDGITVESNIWVDDVGLITDVNITNIQGTHTWIGDLGFEIESPEGTIVTLVSYKCGSSDNFDVGFDDDGIPPPLPCPYTDGQLYQPEGVLSTVNGQEAQGNWILRIIDDVGIDSGNLEEWTIEICREILCQSQTGDMQQDLVSGCIDQPLLVDYNPSNEYLEDNDQLVFILHDMPGTSIGSIIEVNQFEPEFFFNPTTMFEGITYYVSAVVGDETGFEPYVDLDQECVSISEATPIVFYSSPIIDLPDQILVCIEDEVLLDAGPDGTIYTWSTGATGQQIYVQSTGGLFGNC